MLICSRSVKKFQKTTKPDLTALIYVLTMEVEAANNFFYLMKDKHKNLVISGCGLFLDKTNCFI